MGRLKSDLARWGLRLISRRGCEDYPNGQTSSTHILEWNTHCDRGLLAGTHGASLEERSWSKKPSRQIDVWSMLGLVITRDEQHASTMG